MRQSLQFSIPRRHDGPSIFYSDFLAALQSSAAPEYAFVTPNPIDYLPFDRVRLILNSAFRLSGLSDDTELDKVIEQFDLTGLLQRLIYTLSGGEVVRVAMAKCVLESYYLKKVVVAAPWSLLSAKSKKYVNLLLAAYQRDGNSFEVLNLEGDETDSLAVGEFTKPGSLTFGLVIQSAQIPLSDFEGDGASSVAGIEDFEAKTITSPCLVLGENGHGKSLLMKALAGAIPFNGEISIAGPSDRRVRLLFQDVSNQALLGAASLDWTLQKNESARLLNEMILHDVRSELGNIEDGPTLLKTKMAMVAIRLAEQTAGLILDEPDWGLTRAQSVAFLRAVIAVCDKTEIPLLVISHRDWFHEMMKSCLHIERHDGIDLEKSHQAMRIRISQ